MTRGTRKFDGDRSGQALLHDLASFPMTRRTIMKRFSRSAASLIAVSTTLGFFACSAKDVPIGQDTSGDGKGDAAADAAPVACGSTECASGQLCCASADETCAPTCMTVAQCPVYGRPCKIDGGPQV